MISVDLDMEMPKECSECPFCDVGDGFQYCIIKKRHCYTGDRVGSSLGWKLRPMFCPLFENKPKTLLHFKGQLCDGHFYMTAKEFNDHKMKENLYKQKMKLKKLGNNPALSEEVRETLYRQLFYLNLLELYKSLYEESRNKKHE